ncbi:muts domain V-domain-containing protein [Syncephalis plumigaleata]|nr:muts domain V-domain-containing protein [Syncephalis plumigaleata]
MIRNLLLILFLLTGYVNARYIDEVAQQRESNAATASVLAKQEAEVNATAHQSVDAKLTHGNVNDDHDMPPSCYNLQRSYPSTIGKYQFRIGDRNIDYPIIVATSPDVVRTLVDQHTLLAAALFQSVDKSDRLDIQAEREAEINATADQTAIDYELEKTNSSQHDSNHAIHGDTSDGVVNTAISELQAIENHKIGVDPSLDAATRPVPGTKLLRMVREYQLKHPDRLLLTRVGDFYEVYYEQADELGRMLDMTVITRQFKQQPTRFTGFPHRQLERHLQTLVHDYGRTVALCEQFKDPITHRFDRRVDRVISPGTLIGESFLNLQENNFLLAVTLTSTSTDRVGLAWLDLATGDFLVKTTRISEMETDLARIRPREILLYDVLRHQAEHPLMKHILRERQAVITYQPILSGEQLATQLRSVLRRSASKSAILSPNNFATALQLEDFSTEERAAISFITYYVDQTQAGREIALRLPQRYDVTTTMRVDRNAIQSLELVRTLGENRRRGSLLHTIDRTITKAGSRLLYLRMVSPSTVIKVIENRLDLVEYFYENPQLLQDVRDLLEGCRDIQRSLQKLSLRCGTPVDLLDVLDTIKAVQSIKRCICDAVITDTPAGVALQALADELRDHESLAQILFEAIPENAPKSVMEHGFIQPGITPLLKELHEKYNQLLDEKAELEQQLQMKYKTPSLRLLSHPTLRYFIEIHPRDADKMNEFSEAVLIQTLKGKRRYQVLKWTQLGFSIDEAQQAVLQAERIILDETIQQVLAESDELIASSQVIAKIDVAAALAVTARELEFVRPILTEKPNMGGKSTFLRQNALIVLLAQMGSFVPAARASVGIVDRIFTRIGAADNLSQDQSTFMLEMLECAEILQQATSKSMVIMDEIGRGTSTQEGMAIAYAVLCHLHDSTQCRTLFATHYHELADMLEALPAVACYRTSIVPDTHGGFVYLHQIHPGVSRRSHGILVAQMAGLPTAVINAAQRTLRQLETQALSVPETSSNAATADTYSPLHDELTSLTVTDLSAITPYQALERMQQLQRLARDALQYNK